MKKMKQNRNTGRQMVFLIFVIVCLLVGGAFFLMGISNSKNKKDAQILTVKTGESITLSGKCKNCAVSGKLNIPVHKQTQLKVIITIWEYDPSLADAMAKEFDKINVYVDQSVKEINFNIGEKGNVLTSKKYYISANGYLDNLRVFFGRCLHGDFCPVLEPSKIEINGVMKNVI